MNNLTAELARLAAGFSGTLGLWAKGVHTDEIFHFGAWRDPFPSASTIKLAIHYELMRQAEAGRIDLDQSWPMSKQDQVPGSGVLKDLSPGIQLPIRDLATLMMTISDNTASNLCVDVVGLETINQSMDELGLQGLRLHNKFFRAQPGRPRNQATPADLGSLMDRIIRHQVLTPAACDEILRVMKQVQGPLARRFLPDFCHQPKQEAGPEPVIAAKYGSIDGSRHEVGAVWKGDRGFVYAIMTQNCEDLRWVEENEASLLVSRAAAALYGYYIG